MPNMFTGQEFARHLSAGNLKESIVKIGMAKKHDDSPDTILFAEGGREDWISIPVGVIEQVTFLQTVPCRSVEGATGGKRDCQRISTVKITRITTSAGIPEFTSCVMKLLAIGDGDIEGAVKYSL